MLLGSRLGLDGEDGQLDRQQITIGRESDFYFLLVALEIDTLIVKNKKYMKAFFINALIYYVLLSLVVAFIWILTGISGFIPLRIVLALGLAYYKPLTDKWQ
jgi:hypothetical protein